MKCPNCDGALEIVDIWDEYTDFQVEPTTHLQDFTAECPACGSIFEGTQIFELNRIHLELHQHNKE